jgi:glycerophosphoryl diester phosphodiesterase
VAPLIIAHRGDSAQRPENTLAAFAAALEAGAGIVELDVQLTRDSVPVVIHDASLDRTTSGRGPVREHLLAELRALSAGYPQRFGPEYAGERVPTLAEALAFLQGRARVMIEIKPESVSADAEGGVEALVVAEVRRRGMTADVALLSFDPRALERCRRLAPELTRGQLYSQADVDTMLAGAERVAAALLLPHKHLLSEALRDRCRAAGLRLATWVVDDPEELRALARFELYGIGTNRPGPMLEALAEQAQ